MRMWLVNPEILCRNHLLGEHLEMHMFKGAIENNKNLDGYEKGLLIRGFIKKRHDALVKEMLNRGFNHKTPMKRFSEGKGGFISEKNSIKELSKRCRICRKNIALKNSN